MGRGCIAGGQPSRIDLLTIEINGLVALAHPLVAPDMSPLRTPLRFALGLASVPVLLAAQQPDPIYVDEIARLQADGRVREALRDPSDAGTLRRG